MTATTGAEFIAIGSELLEPWRLDTNGSYIAERLGLRGIALRFKTVVGDSRDDMEEAFRTALRRSDLIIATGGLGPTVDDLTREAVAAVLGLRLVEDEAVFAGISERFRSLGRDMPPRNRLQAMVPEGAEVLPNRLGTAPGLLLRPQGTTIALLPGVPAEMRAMVEESLLPRLGQGVERFAHRVMKIAGLYESEVDRRLAEVHKTAGEVAWTILAAPGQIEIHLRERVAAGGGPAGIDRLDREIARVLGPHLFARDAGSMEETVGRLLQERGATLAIAESLTGGTMAGRLTSVPGASRYFRGGVVCYSDDAKTRIVGVRRSTLLEHGAVSRQTAAEMAEGVRQLLAATWGLAATGYAGPEGGADGAPPGTVCLGLRGPSVSRAIAMKLSGDRAMVRERSSQAALDLLRRALAGIDA